MKRTIAAAAVSATLVALLAVSVVSGAGSPRADAAVAVSASAASGVVVSKAGIVQPSAAGAYLGVFRPDAPFDSTALDSYRSVTDRPPSVVMWFQPWDPSARHRFDAKACNEVLARGAVPLVTWEPWNPGGDPNYLANPANQPAYSLARINKGAFDDYIREWARGAKSVNGPVMIRPMHEMNGAWYPWCGSVNGNSPAEFREAWRRIHGIFKQEGVKNVTWVWSINRNSSPDTPANRYAAYYPGDAYVDWTSVSGFNWGTSREWSTWETFEQLYAEPLRYLKTVGKPIVLSEFGSVTSGGDKSAWIRDAYARIKARPEIKGVVYYDKREVGLKGEQDWQITTTWQTWRAYRAAVRDPHFVPGAP